MTAAVKKRRLGWIPWVGVAVLLGVVIVQRKSASSARGGPLPTGVEIAKAEIGTQKRAISSTGIIASQTGTQVKIGSQITGRIRELPADVGTKVKANQVVAVLDLPDMQAQVDQSRHNVESSEAAVAQAKSRFEQAQETAGYTSEQTAAQIADAEAALKAAQAHVDSADATAKLQPIQTVSDIQKAEAALSSARSSEEQVKQTAAQQVLQAQSSLDDARAAMDQARRTLDRQKQLLAKGYIAGDVVDQSDATYQQLTARFHSAEAALGIAREKTRADLQAAHDQVAQAQAVLDSAKAGKLQDQAQIAQLKNAIETAKQMSAALKLQQTGKRNDLIKKMAVAEAKSAWLQAEAALMQARAQLKYQQDQADKSVIRSPISGTVLSITAQQGETVAAGLSSPTLITVADLSRLEVRAYVDETDIGKVKLGLPCEVRVEAFQNKVFHGNVTKIAAASTTKDNVVTYETTIAVSNEEGLLRPDMTADVSIVLEQKDNVLMVPSESVHREVSRNVVYLLHANKPESERVEVRPVKTGFDDGARTEITDGLTAGDTVVVAGLPKLGVRAPDSQGGGR
jgi:HlyD family secretion protein